MLCKEKADNCPCVLKALLLQLVLKKLTSEVFIICTPETQMQLFNSQGPKEQKSEQKHSCRTAAGAEPKAGPDLRISWKHIT